MKCTVALDLFVNGNIFLKIILQFSSMKLVSMGIEQHYSHSNCIFDKGGFSVSSGLIFPPLSLVHTGFSLVPHGSNDPLIILYSDALIKLMC